MYTGMNHYLTESEWMKAVFMWKVNGQDTLTIARCFNCPEPMIYAQLPHYRKKYPKINEKAAA